MNADLLVTAKQIVTPKADTKPLCGKAMNSITEFSPGAMAIADGKILEVGAKEALEKSVSAKETRHYPDSCITPGLIDPHTHLVYAGSRERDFYERIAGVSYEEIAKRGGGIRDSVRQMRKASEEELVQAATKRLDQLMHHGVTTCEIKSGYGLDLENELKTLRVIQKLNQDHPMELVSTFLGAHEVPDEYRDNRSQYIDLLCEEMLPRVSEEKLAVFCDIFCERDVFSIEESRKILTRAKELGFPLKLHVDELAENFGGAELAAEMGAVSAEHLVTTSDQGMEDMAKAGVLGVLLPATIFFINKPNYARARDFIEKGVGLALATDLNPGSSNTESLQVIMTLAALKLKMTAEEILTAVTHNAACAIQKAHHVGRLQKALAADFVVWDLPEFRQIPYHFGGNRVHGVYKNGVLRS